MYLPFTDFGTDKPIQSTRVDVTQDIMSMVQSLAISGGINVLAALRKPLDTQALVRALMSPPGAE